MHYNPEDLIVGVAGAIVGVLTSFFLGITWQIVFESVANLIWLGFVALFTGAMSVVGKRLIEKYYKSKSNKP